MATYSRLLHTTALTGMGLMTLIVSAVPVFGQDSLDMGRVGQVQEWWFHPTDVILDGDYAYLLTEGPGLLIYNLSDPAAPRVVAREAADGFWGGMTKSGNRLLTAGLYSIFLDVTNPESPQSLAHRVYSVGRPAILGNFVYTPRQSEGFYVWDVTDPGNPIRGTHFSDPQQDGTYTKILVHENFLYLGDSFGYPGNRRSIRILDLADPANPVRIADSISGRFTDFEIDGTTLYACGFANMINGLHCYDISLPDHPQWLADFPLQAFRLGVDSPHLVLTKSDTIHFVDVTSPSEPRLVSSQSSVTYQHASCLDIDGTRMIKIDQDEFKVADISNPENPQQLFEDEIHTLNDVLAVRPPYAIVTEGDDPEIIDFSDERNPRRAGTIPVEGYPQLFANDILYAMQLEDNNIYLYSTEELTEPQHIATIGFPEDSYPRLTVADNYLYILTRDQLTSYDVVNPSAPVFVSEIPVINDYYYLLVEFPLAILWSPWTATTAAVDISDPANPDVIDDFPLQVATQDSVSLAVMRNSIVYAVNSYATATITDFRNPAFPVQYQSAWLDSAYAIVGSDLDYLYISTGRNPDPVMVLDIHTDPLNPQPVGYYPTYVRSAIRNDDRLYVCDEYSFQILSLFGHYAADETKTPFISAFTLHPSYPNPFNMTTTIRFDLPRAQPVVYEVVNTLGQQVLRRDLGNVPAGEHRVLLNSPDWSSGNYWVNVQAGAEIKSTRMVLLK